MHMRNLWSRIASAAGAISGLFGGEERFNPGFSKGYLAGRLLKLRQTEA